MAEPTVSARTILRPIPGTAQVVAVPAPTTVAPVGGYGAAESALAREAALAAEGTTARLGLRGALSGGARLAGRALGPATLAYEAGRGAQAINAEAQRLGLGAGATPETAYASPQNVESLQRSYEFQQGTMGGTKMPGDVSAIAIAPEKIIPGAQRTELVATHPIAGGSIRNYQPTPFGTTTGIRTELPAPPGPIPVPTSEPTITGEFMAPAATAAAPATIPITPGPESAMPTRTVTPVEPVQERIPTWEETFLSYMPRGGGPVAAAFAANAASSQLASLSGNRQARRANARLAGEQTEAEARRQLEDINAQASWRRLQMEEARAPFEQAKLQSEAEINAIRAEQIKANPRLALGGEGKEKAAKIKWTPGGVDPMDPTKRLTGSVVVGDVTYPVSPEQDALMSRAIQAKYNNYAAQMRAAGQQPRDFLDRDIQELLVNSTWNDIIASTGGTNAVK